MIDERDVREMLHRRAGAVPTAQVDAPAAVRRARRRLLVTGVLATVAAAAIVVMGFAQADALRGAPVPADEPTPSGVFPSGIFAPLAGRIVFDSVGIDYGYGSGGWAVDPSGPPDTADGPTVAADVASTLVPFDVDGESLGWSSDGNELLLMRSDGDGLFPQQYLTILHADGSETRLNEEPMGIAGATISPDGTRVVFWGQYDLAGLFAIDADGGDPVHLPLPDAVDVASAPTFSPDGTQIAFLSGNRDLQVWVANADGTDAHQILADELVGRRDLTGLQWSPAGDRLAIGLGTHERGGGSIYTFAPDGSDFTEVIVGASAPSWSPDGSQIAYTIQCDDDPTFTCVQFDPQAGLDPPGLAIADADGSNVRAFGFAASGPWLPAASAGQSAPPSSAPSEGVPTPTGEVLHFTGTFDSIGDLVAVDAATGEQRILVEGVKDVSNARWSMDRRSVAFEMKGSLWVPDGAGGAREVFRAPEHWAWSSTDDRLAVIRGSTLLLVDPSTGRPTELASTVGDITSVPVWSPDGTKIVVGARGGSIYAVDARTGERSLVARLPGTSLDSVDGISWSPDGSRLTVYNDLEPGSERLFVMNADGSRIRVLAEDDHLLGFSWSPDGSRIAFTEDHGAEFQVFVAAADGSDGSLVAKLPSDGGGIPVWSPDGSRIALGPQDTFLTHGVSLVIAADGSGEALPIDDLTYETWRGGDAAARIH